MKDFAFYLLIVSIGFFLDLCVFFSLTYISINIYLSNIIAFIIGSFINLLLIRKFLFINFRFNLLEDWLLTLPLNGLVIIIGTLLIYILHEILAISVVLSKLSSTLVTLIVNYALRVKFFNK